MLVPAADSLQEQAISEAWHRGIDGDSFLVPAFERPDQARALHPTSTADSAKPLVVGDKVTLVTSDGTVINLAVCDPASPSASTAPQCLNAYLARAVPASATRTPQRSL